MYHLKMVLRLVRISLEMESRRMDVLQMPDKKAIWYATYVYSNFREIGT